MNDQRESLPVYCNDRLVGDLHRKTSFASSGIKQTYDFMYEQDVPEDHFASLLMPTARKEYLDILNVPHAFQTSIPEGWVRERLAEQFGKAVSIKDDFSLLRLVGKNPIGRVTFGGTRSLRTLDQELLDRILPTGHSAWAEALFAQIGPENLGASGAMPKLVMRDNGTLLFQDFLLKLETSNRFGIALAEEFALRVSRSAGIPTVDATRNATGEALLIKRFDIDKDGATRLGFEDSCSLNGFSATFKYDGCIEKVFGMIESFVTEEFINQDKESLLKIVLLNDILRNGDAHLKNFGLVYRTAEDVRLTPSYDVLDTTLFIPGDFPALTLFQHFPDEAAQHKKWFDKDALFDLRDIADIDVGDIRVLYRNLQEATMIEAQRFRKEIRADKHLDDERKRFCEYMLDTLEHRIRHEGPLPVATIWKSADLSTSSGKSVVSPPCDAHIDQLAQQLAKQFASTESPQTSHPGSTRSAIKGPSSPS